MSEKMIFCIGDGPWESKGTGFQKNLQIFNKSVTEKEFETAQNVLDVKKFELPLAKWIDIKDVEKPTKTQKQMGGYLKLLSYTEAWKEMWKNMKNEDKKFFLSLPNFDAEIFEKITGIKPEITQSLKGKTVKVELDGVSYEAIIQ